MRLTLTILIWVTGVGALAAQAPQQQMGPTQQQSPYQNLPNFYYRGTQPLSPYLNLLRSGNPAVNFYYGVRPGLPSGGFVPFGNLRKQTNQQQFQSGLIPANPTSVGQLVGFAYETSPAPTTLSPAGHPVAFMNPYGSSAILSGVNSPPRPGGFSRPQPSPPRGKP